MGWRVAIGYDAAIPEQSVSRSWTGWEDPWAATRPTATATAPQTWVALDRMASFLARALETRPGSTGYPAHTVASLLRLGNRPDRLGQRMHGSYRGPMSAGYSGTPLVRKLGIKEGYRVGVVADPGHLAALVDPLPADARLINNPRLPCPLLIVFALTGAASTGCSRAWLDGFRPTGALWIAWPKKSSPRHVDLTEDVIRAVALPLGLVDNKVCAIDGDWSGLRLVVRKENRRTWHSP